MPVDLRYLDPTLPPETRAALLLAQMTLDEKIGQLCMYVGEAGRPSAGNVDEVAGYALAIEEKAALVREGLVGSFLKVPGWREADHLQRLAETSRLRIPLLIATDAIHGHAMDLPAATVFPTPIGIAAAFDADLAARVAAATARELRATGFHWDFSPNVDVTRDPRWGRTGETFGEDPFVAGALGVAMIRGYQGEEVGGPESVLACAKHLVAGGIPENGLNGAPADVSPRTLEEVFLPPFRQAVEAGVETVMPAHNEVNGVPCHGDRRLLEDRLRRAWGFHGLVVSDWMDVERLHTVHRVAESRAGATRLAVLAGVDVNMHGRAFFDDVKSLVEAGALPQARVDEAVRRVLSAKLRLGLFERRYVDPARIPEVVLAPAHVELAREAARKSLVLLRNEGGVLPLRAPRTLLVSGPAADDQTLLGDWARLQPRENVATVLDGLRALAPRGTRVSHAPCGTIASLDAKAIGRVARRARTADACVLVVGENSLRDDPARTSGENLDRASLDLPGRQAELVAAVLATKTPTAVVLVSGAPIAGEWMADAPAILGAFEPGMAGGTAVAEVLYGLRCPAGRLPITFPRSAGHLRTHHALRPSAFHRGHHSAGPADPWFRFGHGLSYTSFAYGDLKVKETVTAGEPVAVSLAVENTGAMAGDEVVLLYLEDLYASVTRPARTLVAFRRVALAPRERRTIELLLWPEALTLLDEELQPTIEPGEFRVIVGEELLSATFRVIAR